MELKDNIFFKRFNEVVRRKKIKQTDLVNLTGIRQSSISDYFNARYLPKQDKIYLLAKALNVSPSWLMGIGEDNLFLPNEPEPNEHLNKIIEAVDDFTPSECDELAKYIDYIKFKRKN